MAKEFALARLFTGILSPEELAAKRRAEEEIMSQVSGSAEAAEADPTAYDPNGLDNRAQRARVAAVQHAREGSPAERLNRLVGSLFQRQVSE
ncbi:hypothetical protein A3D85_01010 [Candidatus Amesbacteria bacterium RIFCSPHIGHO2_02_FULL_47_9]|uniref:Uncharacterized protein n=1 Tax=Candidatus Amesbacteria bacterium RIFCSPHIGHO2_01_FULL_48_32b TaxID=1797253 RepID=A0A1F4YGQ3_9BACT|nr:MAG: hypothetical protein A2876_04790 [Candidatus Amesbacteria bacterium RIFCSPHIGHO2_01_FULL_48_32b]OGD04625.1 MAG: hypothetical protein A3D85_01010 [Candidatus Amesbacteria bacterium RIFCSPHIGHO2_02_FULL_47_9]OGD07012.1 MAG: hypothetical protein A2899_00045 [Candidatus Amesbacteria bacterium RIFCSPLOWO2_01_FULL_49_25]